MGQRSKTFFKQLPTVDDRIAIYFSRKDAEVLFFSTQYETYIEGKWVRVRRYDYSRSHKTPHVHVFHSVYDEFIEPFQCENLNEGLTLAVRILTENYTKFKHNYLTVKGRRGL